MKNIKDITISIFAIIGFVAIISGFTNQAEQSTQPTYGTPESHETNSPYSCNFCYLFYDTCKSLHSASEIIYNY